MRAGACGRVVPSHPLRLSTRLQHEDWANNKKKDIRSRSPIVSSSSRLSLGHRCHLLSLFLCLVQDHDCQCHYFNAWQNHEYRLIVPWSISLTPVITESVLDAHILTVLRPSLACSFVLDHYDDVMMVMTAGGAGGGGFGNRTCGCREGTK